MANVMNFEKKVELGIGTVNDIEFTDGSTIYVVQVAPESNPDPVALPVALLWAVVEIEGVKYTIDASSLWFDRKAIDSSPLRVDLVLPCEIWLDIDTLLPRMDLGTIPELGIESEAKVVGWAKFLEEHFVGSYPLCVESAKKHIDPYVDDLTYIGENADSIVQSCMETVLNDLAPTTKGLALARKLLAEDSSDDE